METGWWANDNDERYRIGPCATRQEAIDEAIAAGVYQELDPEPPEHPDWRIAIYVCEADSPEMTDVKIDASLLLEDLEQRSPYDEWSDPDGGGMFEGINKLQVDDLSQRLTVAFQTWVIEHGLTLRHSAFQRTRHEEHVELPHPQNPMGDP